MIFHLEEDVVNDFETTRELVTTLFDFSLQARDKQISFDSNALAGTLCLIKDQLDNIASKMTHTSS